MKTEVLIPGEGETLDEIAARAAKILREEAPVGIEFTLISEGGIPVKVSCYWDNKALLEPYIAGFLITKFHTQLEKKLGKKKK